MIQVPIVTPSRDLVSKVNAIQVLASRGEAESQEAKTLEADIDKIVVAMYGLSGDDEKVVDEALAVFTNRFPWQFRDSDEYKEYAAYDVRRGMNLYDCGGHGTYLHRHGRYRSSHGHEGSAGGQVLEALPEGHKALHLSHRVLGVLAAV